MKKDIEILKELISWKGKSVEIRDYEITAIENLINRVKELEVDNIHWRGRYHLLSRKIAVIPEDKIKEKIEELEKLEKGFNFTGLITECETKIEVLQELLEEEE